jgi:succinyl-diaminopimelate desuccinylase
MIPSDRLASILADRTLEMVRIASPSGEEAPMADHIERFLADHTSPTHLARHGNALVARFGDRRPQVLLGGHLDTVPANQNPDPVVEDSKVVGLGSTDMKGALAVMLSLAEAWPAATAGSLGLVFYDCEEVAFERNGLRKLFGIEPWLTGCDLALMMEPTANVLELGCLGTLHAQVTFHGKAAHSARPWTGENAIHQAAPFLHWLAEAPIQDVGSGKVVYREVINATLAEGGTTRNVIPDRFTLNLNFRFAPDRSVEGAEDYLRSLIPDEAEVEFTDRAPAAPPRESEALIVRLADRHGLEMRAKQAWTDVAQFAEHGVPAVNFGPGIPDLAHQRDESVPIENLVQSFEILAAFLGLGESGSEGDGG